MSITSQISQVSTIPVAPCGDVLSQYLSHSSVTDSRKNQGTSDSMAPPTVTSLPVTPESEKRAEERSRQPSISSFGAFYKLPPELRLIIWRNLMPELRDESEPSPETYGSPVDVSPRLGNRLAVIRTSFALFYEIRSELYQSRTLRIPIRPQRRGWRAEGLPGSTMADFASAKEFVQTEASRYLALDMALDTAPGPAAATLRRERLIHWRWYWRTLGHLRDSDMFLMGFISFRFQEQIQDFGLLEPSFRDYGWKLEKKNDPQWLQEWRSKWPNGIPPKGSMGWFTVIAAASRR